MIDLETGASEQYINFTTGQRYTATEYIIRRSDPQIRLDLSSPDLPNIPIEIRFGTAEPPEFSLRHLLFNGFLESPQEYSIPAPPPGTFELPLSVLPLDVVQNALEFRPGAEFKFELIIVEPLERQELFTSGALVIERLPGQVENESLLRVSNLATTRLGPVRISGFFQEIGNLERTIVVEPQVEGISRDQWHIEIDDIGRWFDESGYDDLLARASQKSGSSFVDKIRNYIREEFRVSEPPTLSVKIVIETLS
jgi:hypothetical protein